MRDRPKMKIFLTQPYVTTMGEILSFYLNTRLEISLVQLVQDPILIIPQNRISLYGTSG